MDKIGAQVISASIDTGEKAQEVQNDVSFKIGQGVTCEIADTLGSWWEDRRGIIQPSEFVIGADGKVIHSSYSSGPLARTEAADVVKLINFYESHK